jgi:hypothetical protein
MTGQRPLQHCQKARNHLPTLLLPEVSSSNELTCLLSPIYFVSLQKFWCLDQQTSIRDTLTGIL